jgi:hypothetical protein
MNYTLYYRLFLFPAGRHTGSYAFRASLRYVHYFHYRHIRRCLASGTLTRLFEPCSFDADNYAAHATLCFENMPAPFSYFFICPAGRFFMRRIAEYAIVHDITEQRQLTLIRCRH